MPLSAFTGTARASSSHIPAAFAAISAEGRMDGAPESERHSSAAFFGFVDFRKMSSWRTKSLFTCRYATRL